ncbi:hypothetical protein ACKVM9_002430 [Pantoea agglomerans]|uniref:hypothetical protein n=1 Tax=Enterobacter agglomerans TaxID=549 RepID=UPI00390B63C2
MIILFIPSLISLLVSKAEEKGSPLTEEEVLAIRDNATAIVTDAEGVLAVAERRGYQDIDPEHCWEEWLDFNRQD